MSTRRIRICVEQMTGLVFSGPHSLTIERSWRGCQLSTPHLTLPSYHSDTVYLRP